MGQKEAENMEMKILVICMIAIAQTFCETVNLIELRRSSLDSFSLTIQFENETEVYNLSRKKSSHLMTLIADEDESLTSLEENDHAETVYEDPDQETSVIIESDGSGEVFQISGVLGIDLIILPMNTTSRENLPCCPDCLEIVRHKIIRRDSEPKNSSEEGNEADYSEVEAEYRIPRRGKSLSNKGKVHPEILVIVDHTLFKKLDLDSSKAKQYVISYINAVNMRFRTFSQPSIELHLAGVIFGKSKSSFPFISSAIRSRNMLDAPQCLHAMGQYYYKDRSGLPQYDMVVTLTGLDMARMKKGKMSRSNTGYAYIGGACVRNTYLKKISSVALVEDSGGYSGVVVTAHEIGHLLGAVHDGDASPSYLRGPGAKSCPWSAGYIMSDLRHTARGQTWSGCSVKQIRHFLRTSTAGCLYNVPQYKSDLSLAGDRSLPGRSISLDAQCRQDRGTRACYHDHRVCAQLFCYTDNYRGCYAYRPAVEGSSCGTNKMCVNGKCIASSARYGQIKRKGPEKPTASSKTPTKSYGGKTRKSRQKSTRTRQQSQKNKSNKTSKSSLPRKSKSAIDSDCSDSFALMGSLNCDQLFKRYSFHYCGRSKTVRKKCCKSYNKYCGNS